MQVFVRVVETGGLSAAGRALGLAPSSVSRRISELEDMLGVRLLQRTTRKLSLTEAGETYYERSRDIVLAVDEDQAEAFRKALAGDPVSAYGGILGFNRPVTAEAVEALRKVFFEVIVVHDVVVGNDRGSAPRGTASLR